MNGGRAAVNINHQDGHESLYPQNLPNLPPRSAEAQLENLIAASSNATAPESSCSLMSCACKTAAADGPALSISKELQTTGSEVVAASSGGQLTVEDAAADLTSLSVLTRMCEARALVCSY